MTTRLWTPPVLRDTGLEVALTLRQAEVLTGICRGHGADRIAHDLGLHTETVKTHAKLMYRRLEASCAAHAAALACTGQVRLQVPSQPWRRAG